MARPTDLTPEVQERIESAVRAGSTFKVAAESAGISETTYYRWMEQGTSEAEEDAPYREFREALTRARADSAVHAVAVIRQAAREDWRAAAFVLERRFPEDWGKRSTTTLEGSEAKPLRSIVELDTDDDETRRLAHALLARRAGRTGPPDGDEQPGGAGVDPPGQGD